MRRLVFAILIALLIFPSCQTRSDESGFTRDERVAALRILTADMISSLLSDGAVEESFFVSQLPSEYTIYSEYSPSYRMLTDDYTSELSSIVLPLFSEAAAFILSRIDECVSGGDTERMVKTPEGMTDRIQDLLAVDIYNYLVQAVNEMSDELDEAFRDCFVIFSSVRASYLNLRSVGVSITLPSPEPLDSNDIAFAVEAALFTRLAEHEKELKSRIPESLEDPYAVFWEDVF